MFYNLESDFLSFLNQTKFEEKALNNFLSKYTPNQAPKIKEEIKSDIEFLKLFDLASTQYSTKEVLSTRRGMIAILCHRIFKAFLIENPKSLFEIEILARFVQASTNVEIHPKASLASPLAIDHGHGTVIGATSIIGKDFFCYHRITLGASGQINKSQRRHPKLGNNISMGNGSQILGPSIIQDHISIGSNSSIIDSIIESNVRISPGVIISKVLIPQNTDVFAYLPEKREYLIKEKGKNETEIKKFKKINIANITDE